MSSRWPDSVSQITKSKSAFFESFTKLVAISETVETATILRVRFTRFHLKVDEDRPVFFQNVVELIVPIPQVREFISLGIARRFGHVDEADLPGAGNWHRTVGLVGAVFAEAMNVVLGRRVGNGHETAQVHQQAPVAIEQNHAFVSTPER